MSLNKKRNHTSRQLQKAIAAAQEPMKNILKKYIEKQQLFSRKMLLSL